MATLLVTGATGGLGRTIVPLLLDHGHQVRVLSRQAHPAVPDGVKISYGDVRAGTGLAEATRGVETIIHCVSVYEEGFPTDIVGTRNLLEAAQMNGSPHIVFISIAGIDHSPFPYFQAKREAEQQIAQSGLPYTILRATQFHTYILSLITSWEDPQAATITVPASSQFQPIDVSEVADALVALAEGQPVGRAPDVGGPEVLTLDEMAQTYIQVYKKQRTIHTHTTPGAYFDAFRSDEKLVPERAVGRITWKDFLRQRAEHHINQA